MNYKRDVYILMEISFLKEKGRSASSDNSDLFPPNWHLSDDYVLKTEILAEAIKKKIDIMDTDLYNDNMIEGVY